MSKLKLTDIMKTYMNGDIVQALKGVSLEFRENEFVSILGPSGCGKTTLLNIIGGLDRYDSGNLELGGLSTKNFKDADWDAYRNRSIGFVFQSYNLISHQSILQNVEIALTLSGVSTSERRRRAKEALKSVGLENQIKKRPNQLSGGQMQRVAIARALVNNPEIILADEPTGALDSQTSIQVMEILKEISKTRLVIMVTHNGDLANKYSSRIINLLDGEVLSDSNPLFKDGDNKKQDVIRETINKKKLKKTSMSMTTATSLSFKNLMTKKGLTILTSFAGSIGIIGVALVLALSSGLSEYIQTMQSDSLSGVPITINEAPINVDSNIMMNDITGERTSDFEKFTDENILYRYDSAANTKQHTNVLTQEYLNYVSKIETELPNAVNAVSYSKGVDINLLAKGEDTVVHYQTTADSSGEGYSEGFPGAISKGSGLYWQEMPDNKNFVLSLYDLIGEGSRLPSGKNEVAIVVDEYNRIDTAFFEQLGITLDTDNYELSDFIGKTILKVIPNDSFYTQTNNGLFTAAAPSQYNDLYNNADGLELTITGILRVKSTASVSGYLSEGLVYTTALTDYVLDNAQNSSIATAQKKSDNDVITNMPFTDNKAKTAKLFSLGANTTTTGISIYPKDNDGKQKITKYLDAYNAGKADKAQIIYSDQADMISSLTGTLLDTISYVLIAFAAISLVVSTIMIAIITYVSVIERTKEIGILRSVGARKKDISRLFNAETLIIGFVAGLLGVGITYLLSIPINLLISSLVGINGIASLPILYAGLLILGSMLLTLIAGFIPSRMAAKKDPVEALRTE
ncbi:MAG: putative transporter ATP-binding/permease protein [Herbinix sp.]|jgi:putative ABC transport system permease protein|nr:putative transporter ATP-binding/permease protein [Herbinix sp.]MDF2870034.1 putative transporter ATP-binding/permease protein [Anaerocolumna sp.]